MWTRRSRLVEGGNILQTLFPGQFKVLSIKDRSDRSSSTMSTPAMSTSSYLSRSRGDCW
jgi:hypothetical protein